MLTVTDAENQSCALTALISSLTAANQTTVRPQIQATVWRHTKHDVQPRLPGRRPVDELLKSSSDRDSGNPARHSSTVSHAKVVVMQQHHY